MIQLLFKSSVLKHIRRRLNLKRSVSDFSGRFTVSSEVSLALRTGKPVVALESTIITHGMPYPENFSTACKVEDIIRKQDCIPATIAVVNGKIHVGITKNVMNELASMKHPVIKTSHRDLPYVISKEMCGGTTVSATMIAAKMAGINVFVTGGIGGVHRGANVTMDISADLTELGRTPLAVVSSGVKSILDVSKTLEYLETQGVCVVTLGESREFPCFFSPRAIGDDGNPLLSPYCVHNPKEAAQLIHASLSLNLGSGILIAVPPPPDGKVIDDRTDVEKIIQEALKEAEKQRIQGKDITPFVLKEVALRTDGKSLSANVALIQHNAKVGAQIAKELQEIINCESRSKGQINHMFMNIKHRESRRMEENSTLKQSAIIGGSVLDSTVTVQEDFIKMDGRTHAASSVQSFGGVGRNFADALGRLLPTNHPPPLFISAVGRDTGGEAILSALKHLDTSGVMISPRKSTASYTALLDRNGECLMGIENMAAHMLISVDHVRIFHETLKWSPIVIIDGNVPQDTTDYVLALCAESNIPVWFEPTDVKKANKAFKKGFIINFTSPNLNELRAIAKGSLGYRQEEKSESSEAILNEALKLSQLLLKQVNTIFVTLGRLGVMVTRRGEANEPLLNYRKESNISSRLYPPPTISKYTSVSGAGDCFAAAIVAGMLHGLSESECMAAATAAAALSIAAPSTVPAGMWREGIPWNDNASFKTIEKPQNIDQDLKFRTL